MTKTNVLIAAYNEEVGIARTLDALPAELVEPIVAVNGSTDRTADVARSFGATVYEYEERGKLPAIQRTLRHMGHMALEPTLLLDADTRPVFPKLWHNVMLRALSSEDRPIAVAAPVWFTALNASRPDAVVRSAYRMIHGGVTRPKESPTGDGAYYGPNQGLRPYDDETLERILDLPHYWPEEDVATVKALTKSDDGVFRQLVDLRAVAFSPSSKAFPPMHHWLVKKPSEIVEATIATYRANAPEDSRRFDPSDLQ